MDRLFSQRVLFLQFFFQISHHLMLIGAESAKLRREQQASWKSCRAYDLEPLSPGARQDETPQRSEER
ncbi:hypothetical protein D9X91_09805 [Falsibacillus albus]|uniref:Uncharacterized protein n=1 Tax=Falsibacillus albus TaxID=2478915 RepID=A0A3L7K1Q0_9BACI|nr:hypothetical protein D9X91_09805 [Falsibacillus albus]